MKKQHLHYLNPQLQTSSSFAKRIGKSIMHKIYLVPLHSVNSNSYFVLLSSHYTIYAMPVFKKDTDPMSAPFTPLIPYSQLISKAVTPHLVASSSEPLPFVVGQYQSSNFPKQLEFNGTWGVKELKPETYYSFVVNAFSVPYVRSRLHR